METGPIDLAGRTWMPSPGEGVLPSTGTTTTPIWLLALAVLGLGVIALRQRRSA